MIRPAVFIFTVLWIAVGLAFADAAAQPNSAGKDAPRASLLERVNLRDYAKCDGATDDTRGIQAWLNALTDGREGFAPAGVCRFTAGLTHEGGHFSINGSGGQTTVFLYAGASKTTDLLHFTSRDGVGVNGVRLDGFSIQSTTTMTEGWALYVKLWTRSDLHDVIIGGQDNVPPGAATTLLKSWPDGRRYATTKLWNGVHADGADVIYWQSGQISAQNDCLAVNGVSPTQVGSEFFFDDLKISGCGFAGVHSAGGFGGLQSVTSDIIGNGVGVRIDRAFVNAENRETTIVGGAAIDSSNMEGILVDDPGPAYVQLIGTWIASSVHGPLIRVTPRSVKTTVNLKGAYLYNALNRNDALRVENGAARILSTATTYRYITGTAIGASVANASICSVGDSFLDMPPRSVNIDAKALGCGMPMDLPQTLMGLTDASGSATIRHSLGDRTKFVSGFDAVWKNGLVSQAFPSGATVNIDGANINVVNGPPRAKVWITVKLKQYDDPRW